MFKNIAILSFILIISSCQMARNIGNKMPVKNGVERCDGWFCLSNNSLKNQRHSDPYSNNNAQYGQQYNAQGYTGAPAYNPQNQYNNAVQPQYRSPKNTPPNYRQQTRPSSQYNPQLQAQQSPRNSAVIQSGQYNNQQLQSYNDYNQYQPIYQPQDLRKRRKVNVSGQDVLHKGIPQTQVLSSQQQYNQPALQAPRQVPRSFQEPRKQINVPSSQNIRNTQQDQWNQRNSVQGRANNNQQPQQYSQTQQTAQYNPQYQEPQQNQSPQNAPYYNNLKTVTDW